MTTIEEAPAKRARKPAKPIVKIPKGMVDGEPLDVPGGYCPPKGDEIARIVEVLTRDNFATHEDMAKVLHKLLFEMIRDREWWTVYVGGHYFQGLEPTETAIEAWAHKRFHPNQSLRKATIVGPGVLAMRQAEAAVEAAADEFKSMFFLSGTDCPDCGHPGAMHVDPIPRGSKRTTNGTGRCTAGASPGPQRANTHSKGKNYCGCDFALREGIRR